jgi:hypothetical protein
MSFILRILFSGLITFIPSQDGKELTVVLLNANHHHVSDGTELADHKPLLFARAGSCSGDCPTRDAEIAQFIYEEQSQSAAQDALEAAVTGGGAWQLAGSDLSIRKTSANAADLPPLTFVENARASSNGVPLAIPTTSTERTDFSWLADLKQICPNDCTVDPDVLASTPSGIVAARLRLKSGNVFTYSIARVGTSVTPVHFQRLDGTGSPSPYSQAVASWMGADIEVTGDSIEIVDTKFNGDPGRSMTLAPDENGKVEVAVLNMPPFVPPASPPSSATPGPGKHFDRYYDVSATPLATEDRLVPQAGGLAGAPEYPDVDWALIHPQEVLWSDLLNALRLNIGRTSYDRILCPPTKDPLP